MTPFVPQHTGHIDNPKDKRDFTIPKVHAAMATAPVPRPDSYSTDISKVPVLMQGHEPACITHSTVGGMMVLDNGAYSFDYSPRGIYALCKRDDGIKEDGTYYRIAFKEAQTYGVPDNAQFPNDITLPTSQYANASLIPQSAYDVAKDRKMKSYVYLGKTIEVIKQGIADHKIVLISIDLGPEFWTAPNGQTSWLEKDILPLRPPKVVTSRHAVFTYAYNPKYIYFRNSFSSAWGQGGNGYFGDDYEPYIVAAWAIMDLAPETIQILKIQLTLLEKVVFFLKQLLHIT